MHLPTRQKKYGGLGVGELRRLRQLEEENTKLKQIVADLSLDKQMLQDVLKKSSEGVSKASCSGGSDQGLPGIDAESLQDDWAAPLGTVLCTSPA